MLRNPLYSYGPRTLRIPFSVHLGEYLLEKVKSLGDRVAFINAEADEYVTYGEIAQKAANLAVSLSRMGVKRGDTVGICTENRREFWSTVIGIMCTGAAVTTINITYTKDELKHILFISKPSFIICSPEAYKTHQNLLKSQKFIKNILLYGNDKIGSHPLYNDLVAQDVNLNEFMVVEVQGQTDIVLVLYSSGTTGLPKGVQLTHYNGVVCCEGNFAGQLEIEVRVMTIAPWYHSMGFWGSLASISNGRTTIYVPRFEEKLYLQSIQKYKPMMLTVVPPVLVMLSKSQIIQQYDVSSVVMLYSGAAPTDMDTIKEVQKRFPNSIGVLQGYGMTETTLAVCKDLPQSQHGLKQGSVGFPVEGCVLKVVDLETGKPLGPRQQGEICVKGATIMKGYVGKAFSEDVDDEGFFKTGDIGYYDEDKYFFIVDRLKELIKYKGYQVPPAELEAELLQHPAVRDAGVIGIPNQVAGEVPMAFVVKQPGSDVTEEELKTFIAKKLSNPKHLRGGVRFIDAIPKNPTGKILRRELRKMAKSGKSKL